MQILHFDLLMYKEYDYKYNFNNSGKYVNVNIDGFVFMKH